MTSRHSTETTSEIAEHIYQKWGNFFEKPLTKYTSWLMSAGGLSLSPTKTHAMLITTASWPQYTGAEKKSKKTTQFLLFYMVGKDAVFI